MIVGLVDCRYTVSNCYLDSSRASIEGPMWCLVLQQLFSSLERVVGKSESAESVMEIIR